MRRSFWISLLIIFAGIVFFELLDSDSYGEALPESIRQMVLKDLRFFSEPIEKSFTPHLFISKGNTNTFGAVLLEHDASLSGVGEKTGLWRDKFLIPNGYLRKAFRTKSEQGKFDWREYNQMWSEGGVKDLIPTEKLRLYLRKDQKEIIHVKLAKRVLKSIDYTNKWKLNGLDTWSFTFTYFLEPVLPELPRLGPFEGKGTAQINPATGKFETVTEKDVGRYGSTLGDHGDKEYTAWLEKQSVSSKPDSSSSTKIPPKPSPEAPASESSAPETPEKITIASLTKDMPDAGYFQVREESFNVNFNDAWDAVITYFKKENFKIINSDRERGVLITDEKKTQVLFPYKEKFVVLIEKVSDASTKITVKGMGWNKIKNQWEVIKYRGGGRVSEDFLKEISKELKSKIKQSSSSDSQPKNAELQKLKTFIADQWKQVAQIP